MVNSAGSRILPKPQSSRTSADSCQPFSLMAFWVRVFTGESRGRPQMQHGCGSKSFSMVGRIILPTANRFFCGRSARTFGIVWATHPHAHGRWNSVALAAKTSFSCLCCRFRSVQLTHPVSKPQLQNIRPKPLNPQILKFKKTTKNNTLLSGASKSPNPSNTPSTARSVSGFRA